MKIISHRVLDELHVKILFDELDLKYSDLSDYSEDPKFVSIVKKYGLTCDAIDHPNWKNRHADIWNKKRGGDLEHVYAVDSLDKVIVVHRQYPNLAAEAFVLLTGQDLKLMWEDYFQKKSAN